MIFLSGDRHLGALYREKEGTPYPLTEITSSGLNRFYAEAREAGPNRIGAVFGKPNFGTVDIDWWAGEVSLAVRDESGESKRLISIDLEELRVE